MTAPRVMIVEDDRIVALNLRQSLARLGYNTDQTATNGQDALQRISQQPPDIVLMDIQIEGDIDGIETVARIPANLLVPVIYLTSHAEDSTLERAQVTNPYGYLLKPFSERELNATIKMALSRRACDMELREREEKLHLALAAAELTPWELDPATGHILYKDHIGWSSDASPRTVAQSLREFLGTVHEEDQDAVRAAFDQVSDSSSLCEVEFRRNLSDGQERWYRVVGKAVYAPNDRRRRIVGVSRDVTNARVASQERLASEESYRELISTIDGVIWEADLRKEVLTYVSDSVEHMLGYTAKDWMTTPQFWEKHLHPEDAERAIAEYRAASTAGRSYESTYRLIDNDGDIVWIHEAVSTVAKANRKPVLRGVMVDITNLKKAEQKIESTAIRLAESERRLSAILDTAAVGIVSLDEDLHIISFNIEAERIFGRPAGEVLGLPFGDLIPDEPDQSFDAPGAESPRDGDQLTAAGIWRAITGRAADGRVVPITMIVSNVTVAGMSTITVILRDMTEVQKAEEEMRRLLEEREFAVAQGEVANRAKSSFLAVMSHELRTPLNAIIGFSDIIGREMLGPIGNEVYRGYAVDISHSGNLLLATVNNILDLSRIEGHENDLDIRDLHLTDVWEPISSTLRANAGVRGVTLTIVPSPTPERMFAGDRNAVSHILLNLVSNSIKFTAAGGSIEIGQEDDGESKRLALYVRDTGRGIPADKLADVLKPFVQVTDPHVSDDRGVGLGLAICKSLAEAMGGKITVESQVGKGTIVRVILRAGAPVAMRATAPSRPARGKKPRAATPSVVQQTNGQSQSD